MNIRLIQFFLIAKYRTLRGDWRGAAAQYRRLLDAQPQSHYWAYRLAEALYKGGDSAAASMLLGDISSDGLSHLVLKINILDKLQRFQDIDEEKPAIERAASPKTLGVYGFSLAGQERWEEALEYLLKAYEIKGWLFARDQNVQLLYHIGYVYEKLGVRGKSKEFYQSALSKLSDRRAAAAGVGTLHLKYKKSSEAVMALRAATKNNPTNAEAHFNLGRAYNRLGQSVKAADSFAQFVKNDRRASKFVQNANPRTVVFDAYMGRNISCSPKAIYNEMKSGLRYTSFRFYWVVRGLSIGQHWRLMLNPRVTLVIYGSKQYFRAYARAKYWVTNSRIPLVQKSNKDQIYIQCWHGTPLKKLGHSIEKNHAGVRHNKDDVVEMYDQQTKQFDYFVSPSSRATEYLDEAFNLGKFNVKVLETGYPRNDFLHTFTPKDVTRVKKTLNIPTDKKVLLYAPTWRDDQFSEGGGYTYKTEADFDALQKGLGDEWVILFRAHYFIANSFNFSRYQGFIIDASNYDDINDLYIASDALMTDYSSVFFDYANLKRPIIFFMYDLEHYQKDLRGFYLDLKDLPGRVVKKEHAVVSILSDLEKYNHENEQAYRKFSETYTYLDDGQAAKRVVESVF